jgi:hypothetical protein
MRTLLCIVAAVVYGIVHDQRLASVLSTSPFFHPHIFPTQSPTLLAIGWGILATWWVGAFLRVLLAIAARAGPMPKLTSREVFPSVARLLLIMGGCALVAGVVGYLWARGGLIAPPPFVAGTPHLVASNFMADWWAHSASYASGFFGGLALCVLIYRKRTRLARTIKREVISN